MFDYFSVLISVILGLALTHVLRGVARLIHLRHERRVYWVQLVWTVNLVWFVLAIWFGMFWWKGLEAWTSEWFFFLSGYAVLIFMWASMLWPWESWHGLTCEEFFFANRTWFFGFQLAVILMDIPETLHKASLGLRPMIEGYWVLISLLLLITLAGLLTRNRRAHAVIALAWSACTISYLLFTSAERIAAHAR